ncbi:hypothetical protein B0H16DRAFT_1428388 [Mycena metata]|uniref:Uncharacterized protein n=1 Tax=Mycena metata TaxID=1033252 RepID=A0AAD7HUS9_9AGAR|nr:hypothetical protein B0H16DRAFT_1428388 [Mycena metata]
MKDCGTIDYISGYNEHFSRFYFLKKSTPAGEQLIVIQAEPVVTRSVIQSHTEIPCESESDQRGFNFGLELIHTLLPTIEFGATNWGYLVGSNNNYRIVAKTRQLEPITEVLPWCPLVDERDIKITRFLWAEDREGLWNGMEVDVFMAVDTSVYLKNMMSGYRLLIERNLEHLAYPVVGHVVRSGTAEICGLMTEPSYGRMAGYKDKSAVYKAISEIERAGLLLTGIYTSNVMITHDGKVHFLANSVCALMRQAVDPRERAKEIEEYHWTRLGILFKELEQGCNPHEPPRNQRTFSTPLPYFPTPVQGPIMKVWAVVLAHVSDSDQQTLKAAEETSRAVVRHGPTRGGKTPNIDSLEVLFFDEPISPRLLRAPRTRLIVRPPAPYQKPDKHLQELIRAHNWQRGRQLSQ